MALAEANRQAWNNMAKDYYTKPWQLKLAQQVSVALQERKDWFGVEWADRKDLPGGRDVRLLDYACGTGAVTKTLGPWVHTMRGIDVSDAMVDRYNETARESGMSEQQAHAVVGDLVGDEVPADLTGNEWYNFDVAAIGLGFHHFEDPLRCLQRLVERLKAETGVLIIVDFLPFYEERAQRTAEVHSHQDGGGAPSSLNDMRHTIKHDGFTRDQVHSLFTQAGLMDFEMHVLPEPAVMELAAGTRRRTIFIAKGRKQPTVVGKLWNWLGHVSTQMTPRYEQGKSWEMLRKNYTVG